MAAGVREVQHPTSGESGRRKGPSPASPSHPPQHPRVVFHVTGFGVFNGIPDNPTTHLVRSLPEELRARGFRSDSVPVDESHSSAGLAAGLRSSDTGLEVHSHAILDVSAQEGGRQVRAMHARLDGSKRDGARCAAAVRGDDFLAGRSLYDSIVDGSGEAGAIVTEEKPEERTEIKGADSAAGGTDFVGGSGNGRGRLQDDDNGEIIVFVHCGVDGGSKTFKLETRGYNEATFRVPDEQGYWPTKVPIDESNPDISHVRETTLPISEVLDRLHEMGWGDDFVQESTSAGRFVCNYVYYTSLGLCEKASAEAAFGRDHGASVAPEQHRRHCLFLHVPPFSEIPKDQQLKFVADCLAVIAKSVVAAAGPSRTDAASFAATTDMFASAPAAVSSPSTTDSSNNRTKSPNPVTVSPCRRNASPRAPPAPPGLLARSSSLPYSGTSRRASPPFPVDRNHAGSPNASIWDNGEGSGGPREHRGSLMLPLPLLTADQELKHSRSRSAASVASRHYDIDDNLQWAHSHQSHDDHDEDEQETAAELTRRRLIEAGFEMLDVDAAMATTGSDDMETNMQLLLDIGPLLPRGSPAVGDIDALREFLSSANDHVGNRERGIGGGGGGPAPRPSSGGKRGRTKSVGSAAGMAGVSPRWKADITPRVVPGNGNPSLAVSSDTSTPRFRGGIFSRVVPEISSPSATVSSDTGAPRGRGGLFNSVRRRKKAPISTGSSASSTGASAASSPPGARNGVGAHERVAGAGVAGGVGGEGGRSTPNKPITARPQFSSSTTTRARGMSPEYSRRTTGNSHSQSPSPSPFRAVGNLAMVSPSAGWGDTSLVCSTLRLVLVVRLDAGMGPGAIAAQCCRAALSAARKAEGSGRADALAVWRDAGEEMVVLAARDARALSAILEAAAISNLPITMVRDKGAEWSGGAGLQADTCTVAALGPAPMSALHSVAGGLPVL